MTQIIPQRGNVPAQAMNPVVEQIGNMHFEGNLIPHNWYQTDVLKLANGKPNLVAITLLSDIVYWYRPTVIRDETTGHIIAVRQKFKDTRLQKNYRKWGDGFGFTLRQVEDAMAFLKARGLITVERRAVFTDYGTLPNCAFIEPIPSIIEEISSPVITGDVSPQKGVTPHGTTGEGARSRGTSLPLKRETIPKTLTKNIKEFQRPAGPPGVASEAAGKTPCLEETPGFGEAPGFALPPGTPANAGRAVLAVADSDFAREYRRRRKMPEPPKTENPLPSSEGEG